MSVIDILTRVDAICQKYDKYDIEKHKEQQISGGDAFSRLYSVVDRDVDAALQKANDAANEKNRAAVVTINAEIRRTKARLREEIPKLQRLAQKRVKGLPSDELDARSDLVLALAERIESVPDGMGTGGRQTGNWRTSNTRMEIKIDSSPTVGDMRSEYYEMTEEAKQFRQEYDVRKAKQDQDLDVIGEGLDTLKNMAEDINEEIDRQVPLMDEIDSKVDQATSSLKSTNVRLKETVTKLRSSRNFCIDIILLCIILGIAAYLYNVLKK
ncbi:syntaxin-71 isoform X1 [Cryptomeria japonica]|uniref:syntaxin-71 isoform X1 n=1 Tax=Cryptomeria japonica TaxID=3369 RepID=UPI0027DA3E2A|nr:syntaxin-71 isoform X1 [Cryptomeria japonica]